MNRASLRNEGKIHLGAMRRELRVIAETPVVAIERPLVAYRHTAASLSADRVAEIASIDRLWTAILERPERYPAVVVELIEQQRPATLRTGCRIALRLGRFPEAIPFAEKALRSDRSTAGLMLLGLARLLDNAAGRAIFRFARSLWRRRRSSQSLPRDAILEAARGNWTMR